MFDFWLPMLLLFVAATITAVASRNIRDRCLKYFNDKPVMLLMDTGKLLWGRSIVYPQQIELLFEKMQPASESMQKASYILYSPEIEGISLILQPVPTEDSPEYDCWKKEIELIAHPSLYRRIRRWIWNVMNTLRDAVSQSIGMILGTLKTKTPIGKIAGMDKRSGEISSTLLGTVPNAYEPMLEKYLSRKVVVEMVENGEIIEYIGLLQEYSENYLLLRDIAFKPAIKFDAPIANRFDVIFPRKKALVRHCLK